MKNRLNKAAAWVRMHRVLVSLWLAGVIGTSTLVGAAGVASAATYDPTSDVTNFAQSAASTAGPLVVIVAGAFIGLALLFWGVRAVYRFISGRHAIR
jgi:hypothetical protein